MYGGTSGTLQVVPDLRAQFVIADDRSPTLNGTLPDSNLFFSISNVVSVYIYPVVFGTTRMSSGWPASKFWPLFQ